jgi:hypothetical protein
MADAFKFSPMRYVVKRYPSRKVKYSGVDQNGFGSIVAENDQILVIKWPGGKHWAGRGLRPGYHSPCTDILQKDSDGRFTLLISWDHRQRKEVNSVQATATQSLTGTQNSQTN